MRTVVTKGLESADKKADDYTDKIIKYLPGEAVALYITAIGLISAVKEQIPFDIVAWVIFFGLFFALPIYLWKTEQVKVRVQIVITMAAYVFWAMSLGGPFLQIPWYHPVYGAIGVLFFTFLVPKMR